MRLLFLFLFLGLLGLLPACGGDGSTAGLVLEGQSCDRLGEKRCGLGPEGDATVMLCSAGSTAGSQWVVFLICSDECLDEACVSFGGDSRPQDGTGDQVGTKDSVGLDGSGDQRDATPKDSGPTCAGYMEPCSTNENCCSPGLCVNGPDGMVCTAICWEDCPLGWLCQETGMPPDSMWVCLFQEDLLCTKECLEDEDCKAGLNLCLPMGLGDKQFCSRDCTSEACPPDYTCTDIPGAGPTARQCVPDSGACECLGMTAQDYISDPNNCGACGVVCAFDNAQPLCVSEECARGECLPGFVDLNGDDQDGCEYPCDYLSDLDLPDPDGVDADCDGLDGTIKGAVFVSATTGMDTGNTKGSLTLPVRSLEKGLSLALKTNPPKQVYVAQGDYKTRLELPAGVHLFGGFDPDDWTRNPATKKTRIHWDLNGPGGIVTVLARNLSVPGTFDGFTVEAATNAASGGNSVALAIINCTDALTVSHNVLLAGNGGNGLDGGSSGPGGDGGIGQNGSIGCEYAGVVGSCSECIRPGGGTGGAGKCGNSGGDGGVGGGNDSSGYGGQPSQDGSATGGAGGGAKNSGGPGDGGKPGNDGQPGNGGTDLGTLGVDGLWLPSAGTSGTDGTRGGGGAGGGGGGGDGDCVIFCCKSYGGSGGGGGAGGCPGLGGKGGGGGGASIGVLALDSGARIVDNQIHFRFGGNGGLGGTGGSGGAGGKAGAGSPGGQTDNEGGGGPGGAGGKGGSGGAGGGGSGGVSFGILWQGSASPTCTNNDFAQEGYPGLGGKGGLPGTNDGPDGQGGPLNQPNEACKAE